MSSYTKLLVLTPTVSGKTFRLFHGFEYHVGSENSGDTIRLKAGFETDLASIPRIFRTIVPVLGKHINAAVVHDWLYAKQIRSRKESDRIFLEAMTISGVKAITKHTLYQAVRAFGWLAWRNNKKKLKNGAT